MPLVRLGVVAPTVDSLKAVACSFAGYHAIKRHASSASFTDLPLTFEQTRDVHRIFYDAFCAVADDCQLACVAFSTVLRGFQGAQWARLYSPGL